MKRRYLHIVCGIMFLVCSCQTLMAAEEVSEIEQETVTVEASQSDEAGQSIENETITPSKGEEVVEYALQFIGTPYVSGGNDLNRGVDCSGFAQQVYKHFGVDLERSSGNQYANNGYTVSQSELKAGDLVFYGYNSVCHVAIYIGDSKVVHAPVPGQNVCVVPVWQRGDAPIIGYKRVLKD